MAKPKAKEYRTPKGIAIFPKLNEPDYKYNKGGEWTARLKFDIDNEEHSAFADQINAFHDAAYETIIAEKVEAGVYKNATVAKKKIAKADSPVRFLEDEDAEPTNEFTVNFKQTYNIVYDNGNKTFQKIIKIYDAAGKLLKNVPPIWGGSGLKVIFTVAEWGNEKNGGGASFRLAKVQIIDLVNSDNSDDSGESGFDEEEGYEDDGQFDAPTGAPAAEAGDPGAEDDGTGDF